MFSRLSTQKISVVTAFAVFVAVLGFATETSARSFGSAGRGMAPAFPMRAGGSQPHTKYTNAGITPAYPMGSASQPYNKYSNAGITAAYPMGSASQPYNKYTNAGITAAYPMGNASQPYNQYRNVLGQ